MKYIIMCGGNYPHWETPKQLLTFKGEKIVERTIRLLRENGIQDISISSNNPLFDTFGVPVLHHENTYTSEHYNECTGFWCECFYPTNEPTCYIFGDVVFSENAIRTIVEYEGTDIMLFGSAPPFPVIYPKPWIEPFAFKVWDTDHLKRAIAEVKDLKAMGRFRREPIAWEMWNVISRGKDGDVNTIDHHSYVHINDWTCDIDNPSEIGNLEYVSQFS